MMLLTALFEDRTSDNDKLRSTQFFEISMQEWIVVLIMNFIVSV